MGPILGGVHRPSSRPEDRPVPVVKLAQQVVKKQTEDTQSTLSSGRLKNAALRLEQDEIRT
jgi:hypothetical protein